MIKKPRIKNFKCYDPQGADFNLSKVNFHILREKSVDFHDRFISNGRSCFAVGHGLDVCREGEDLLFEGMQSEDGVYERCFTNKEGKFRVTFVLRSGADVRPVSPQSIRLPRNLPYGTPVSIYLDEKDPARIVAVRLAPRKETDHFGNIRTVTRTNALTIEKLAGEELARYEMDRA